MKLTHFFRPFAQFLPKEPRDATIEFTLEDPGGGPDQKLVQVSTSVDVATDIWTVKLRKRSGS